MTTDHRFLVPARTLEHVRPACHSAVQWASRAARANLPPADDDSHSSLSWSHRHNALLSLPLDDADGHQMGFTFSGGSLIWCAGGDVLQKLALVDVDDTDVRGWCDARMIEAGLKTTDHAAMPYSLEATDLGALKTHPDAATSLGAWFDAAHVALSRLAREAASEAIRTPKVRCWPHHFDIATLVTLGEGGPETAPSVGIGLSPGDASFTVPYFYCTPWPAPAKRPPAPEPWHWHTEGFTSLVCPIDQLGQGTALETLLDAAYAAARGTWP